MPMGDDHDELLEIATQLSDLSEKATASDVVGPLKIWKKRLLGLGRPGAGRISGIMRERITRTSSRLLLEITLAQNGVCRTHGLS
jgi:hypothetical protein